MRNANTTYAWFPTETLSFRISIKTNLAANFSWLKTKTKKSPSACTHLVHRILSGRKSLLTEVAQKSGEKLSRWAILGNGDTFWVFLKDEGNKKIILTSATEFLIS